RHRGDVRALSHLEKQFLNGIQRSTTMATIVEQRVEARRVVDRLLNKWAVERETSLDITTIYRKMKAGTFPQPVRVGKRRVAWRESDVAAWQASLTVGTRL